MDILGIECLLFDFRVNFYSDSCCILAVAYLIVGTVSTVEAKAPSAAEVEKQLAEVEGILKKDPKDIAALDRRIAGLNLLGRTREANELCDEALKIESNRGFLWFNKGYCRYTEGRWLDAITFFEKASTYGNFDGLVLEAICFRKLGKFSECIEFTSKWIDRKHDQSGLFFIRGLARHALKQSKQLVCLDLRRALELAPGEESILKGYEKICLEADNK